MKGVLQQRLPAVLRSSSTEPLPCAGCRHKLVQPTQLGEQRGQLHRCFTSALLSLPPLVHG